MLIKKVCKHVWSKDTGIHYVASFKYQVMIQLCIACTSVLLNKEALGIKTFVRPILDRSVKKHPSNASPICKVSLNNECIGYITSSVTHSLMHLLSWIIARNYAFNDPTVLKMDFSLFIKHKAQLRGSRNKLIIVIRINMCYRLT